MTSFPYWPSLPVKRILAVQGKLEYYLKARETSEQLIPANEQRDGNLSYQFYYNKASKLIGYRFAFEPVKLNGEHFPRATVFSSSVFGSYVPLEKVQQTGDGEPYVIYHDLSVRLIKYTAPADCVTYWVLMRSKMDTVG